jgi:SAM-dependent methyltransferase
VDWSLEYAYDAYPQVEEAFDADLEESLDPRGPQLLFDLVGGFGLPDGARAIDVGCGEGADAIALAQRYGFVVTGIDPVPRHIKVATAASSEVAFVLGRAERLPVSDSTVDLIWCRDVLGHVADLERVYAEFRRVLRPGGRVLVAEIFGAGELEPVEAAKLWAARGVVAANADPARTEAAIGAAGLGVDEVLELGAEWGEWGQEQAGWPGRHLLHLARLRRGRETYVQRYGQAAYDYTYAQCLWHVYVLIGKLSRRIYLLS